MIERRRHFHDFLVGRKSEKRRESLLVKEAQRIDKTFIIKKFRHFSLHQADGMSGLP